MFLLHHLDQKLNVVLINLMFSVKQQKRDELHQEEMVSRLVYKQYGLHAMVMFSVSAERMKEGTALYCPRGNKKKTRRFFSLAECGTESQECERSYSQNKQNVAAQAGMKETWRQCGCANISAADDMKNQIRRWTTQRILAWMHDSQGKETRWPLLTLPQHFSNTNGAPSK